jgi:hypothetical protein
MPLCRAGYSLSPGYPRREADVRFVGDIVAEEPADTLISGCPAMGGAIKKRLIGIGE